MTEKPTAPNPHLGMHIYRRHELDGKIEFGIVLGVFTPTPLEAREGKEKVVNCIIFKDGSGYTEFCKRVPCGLKKGQWWHSLAELEAQLAIERNPITLT